VAARGPAPSSVTARTLPSKPLCGVCPPVFERFSLAQAAEGALKIKAETWNTDVNLMMMEGGPHNHEHGDMAEPAGETGEG
jgi:hypothetical protein